MHFRLPRNSIHMLFIHIYTVTALVEGSEEKTTRLIINYDHQIWKDMQRVIFIFHM